MHELVAKLTTLDPDAGAAVQVIRRFDELIEGRAGLEPILTAVAVLTGCAARLVVADHRVDMRIGVDGVVENGVGAGRADWLSAPLVTGGPPAFWLERGGSYSMMDVMVLDRAAFAAREVLHRTRGRATTDVDDPAAIEVLLDRNASEHARLHAAGVLHLPTNAQVRAVARAGAAAALQVQGRERRALAGRTGIGPAVAVLELPVSWEQARTALRFASEGTDDDPGPSVVVADELGALLLLAAALDPAAPPTDVRALESAAKVAPWVLRTLVAFSTHASLRLAAAALFVHHSTLQDRITVIEHELGWAVRDPQGRLRVQLALAVRRLLLHPA